jgi:hypothetical protein
MKGKTKRSFINYLLNMSESPLLCMGMNGSQEQGGGTEAQVVGFKEAPPFGRGTTVRLFAVPINMRVNCKPKENLLVKVHTIMKKMKLS